MGAKGPTEPHGNEDPETDWKAESRKWEGRAKENKDAADELARIKEASATDLEKAQARAKKAEDKLAMFESEKEHTELVRKVMATQHVDARYASVERPAGFSGSFNQSPINCGFTS
jgi:septal ring factor EnvC (AmiA/AmiB activator)